jgi:hypothetical protein
LIKEGRKTAKVLKECAKGDDRSYYEGREHAFCDMETIATSNDTLAKAEADAKRASNKAYIAYAALIGFFAGMLGMFAIWQIVV